MDESGCAYVKNRMPMLGLGTWQVTDRAVIFETIDAALDVGYRFIDTAQVYRNEEMIGDALAELLPKHGLSRSDVFITSKLAPANQGTEHARESILESLRKLRTDYLDLLLIHWPGAGGKDGGDPLNQQLRQQSWQTMEAMSDEGKLRAIGVSNYNESHLEQLFQHACIRPAVNQCEFHPHYADTRLLRFCQGKGIHYQAYSSFGSASHRDELFSDERVIRVAARHNCSVPVVLLAWALNQGASVLPRSTSAQHVRDNFQALQMKLDEGEIREMTSESMKKTCWDPKTIT